MYTELYELTAKMRSAAVEGRWEDVLQLEQSRHILFERLSAATPESPEQQKLLAAMLAATDEISALAAAHTEELRERLGRTVTPQLVCVDAKI